MIYQPLGYETSRYTYLLPYTVSKDLRWSYAWPYTGKAMRWHSRRASLEDDLQVKAILLAGFDGVWLDMRSGQSASKDKLRFGELPDAKVLSSTNNNFVFIDLSGTRADMINDLGTENNLLKAQEWMLSNPC